MLRNRNDAQQSPTEVYKGPLAYSMNQRHQVQAYMYPENEENFSKWKQTLYNTLKSEIHRKEVKLKYRETEPTPRYRGEGNRAYSPGFYSKGRKAKVTCFFFIYSFIFLQEFSTQLLEYSNYYTKLAIQRANGSIPR